VRRNGGWFVAVAALAALLTSCDDSQSTAPSEPEHAIAIHSCEPDPGPTGPNGDPSWSTPSDQLAGTQPSVFSGVRWDGGAQQVVFGTVNAPAAESLIADGLPDGIPYRLEIVPRNGLELRALMNRGMAIDGVFSAAPRSWNGTVVLGVDADKQAAAMDAITDAFADDLSAICVTLGEQPVAG
jgi:hypothetical protein